VLRPSRSDRSWSESLASRSPLPTAKCTGADPADTVHVWLPLATLAVAATTPYLLRNWRDASSRIVILGAGFAFALSAFCAKLLADAITRHAWGTLLLVAATAAFGGAIGTLSEQSALQRRQATQVAPLVFVIELLIPVGLAVTVVGEDWHRSPTWIGICLALVTAGTVALARTPTIAQLITSGQFDTPATPPGTTTVGQSAAAMRVRKSETIGSPGGAAVTQIRALASRDFRSASKAALTNQPVGSDEEHQPHRRDADACSARGCG
jgi:hypothetical protein